MQWLFILLIVFPAAASAQQQDACSIHDLKTGKFTDDKSNIYTLPF